MSRRCLPAPRQAGTLPRPSLEGNRCCFGPREIGSLQTLRALTILIRASRPKARGEILTHGSAQGHGFSMVLKQATGGMRQLATCFRGDFRWSLMAQQLETREKAFRDLLLGKEPRKASKLILPPGYH